ncbi:hypothetical protein FCL47_17420 [Desulfopila sp. IMCC35006]|uniref:F0F1 ATP synthase subunit delta n=1 Tax=Desulfopila sp. IMCC35006 TaxID=2569542 RepID=UPI0010AB8A1F|nr:F0F1 ATP synthase subunit delta [Desulfopila sp. IMCC35006]TKB24613.1 hypothetical protein FCL47_17420 [Desulfopila sp. IMCC35006]
MSAMFSRRVRELDRQTKEDFAAALKTSSGPALVRSVFSLSSEPQVKIRTALKETFVDEIQVHFAKASEVISGIELTINGRKIAWSINHYLLSLQEIIDELLKESSTPQENTKLQLPPSSKPKQQGVRRPNHNPV